MADSKHLLYKQRPVSHFIYKTTEEASRSRPLPVGRGKGEEAELTIVKRIPAT
jgi:hypothetical protein